MGTAIWGNRGSPRDDIKGSNQQLHWKSFRRGCLFFLHLLVLTIIKLWLLMNLSWGRSFVFRSAKLTRLKFVGVNEGFQSYWHYEMPSPVPSVSCCAAVLLFHAGKGFNQLCDIQQVDLKTEEQEWISLSTLKFVGPHSQKSVVWFFWEQVVLSLVY